jgi:ribose transport system ATP-binding protein
VVDRRDALTSREPRMSAVLAEIAGPTQAPRGGAASSAAEPLVRIERLAKSFEATRALVDVSFDIRPGTIHCLLGENGAGKSTVGKILAGVHRADAGRVLLGGAPAAPRNVAEARALGIAIVFQELSLAPDLSVRENIFLGSEGIGGLRFARARAERAKCAALLAPLELEVDPDARLGDLPVAQQQLVEIAKALQAAPRLLILDEPTAMLGMVEKRRLFDVLRRLRAAGTAILFVTHHLDEVMALGDCVTVLRDGRLIETFALDGSVSAEAIVERVSGRRPVAAGDRHPHDERVLLTIAGVRDRDGRETTIELRRGEIVGLYGVVGSGCEAIAAEVAGLRRAKARRLALAGRPYRPASPAEAAAAGVGYLPSGRAANGIFPSMTVRDNLMLTQLRPLQRAGWVDVAAERRSAVAQLACMKTRMASAEAPITSLSGGNQQKVVIGRCIARGATLMVLEDPTAGIDVGAKHDIHQILRERAREGVAVLMVSSDLPETLQLCHTVYTVYDGCIVGVYREPTIEMQEAIVADVIGQAG